jgi:hypothetical protein
MKAKCLQDTVWYTLDFKAGEVYDIDEMLYPRLIRTGKFIPAKEPAKVEQPEEPLEDTFKPVATFVPLPESDDLATPQVKPVAKPVVKPKRK